MSAPSAPAPDPGQLPALDAAQAQRRLGGSVRVWSSAARIFLRDAPVQLQSLRLAVEAGRSDVAVRAAHSIRGSAAWIGARRTEAAAIALEQVLQTGVPPAAPLQALDDALWEALAALEPALVGL